MDKMYLQKSVKRVALSDLSIYYTWKNIKTSNGNKKFKIRKITWEKEFELPDGFYEIIGYSGLFIEYIIMYMKHWLVNRQFRYTSTKFKSSYIKNQNWILSWAFDTQNPETTRKYWKKNNKRQKWCKVATNRSYWSDISSL